MPVLKRFPALIALLTLSAGVHADSSDLIIHEWGTFTSFQDEDGITILGVNVDDEPLPDFVHRLGVVKIDNGAKHSLKSFIPLNGGVTMRLETPVIYFHPPKGMETPFEIDVHVEFKGGVLTEYYPRADATTNGVGKELKELELYPDEPLNLARSEFRALISRLARERASETHGTLSWDNLRVGGDWRGPQLAGMFPVWDAPRHVKAAPVRASNGEQEKYLFYRGVGSLESPLRAIAQEEGNELEVSCTIVCEDAQGRYPFRRLWLVQVKPMARIAFREIDGFTWTASKSTQLLTTIPRRFKDDDFDTKNLAPLRASMHRALVEEGLYDDEAEGMLNTWEASYFLTPGLRLFYTVPPKWTDEVLPLTFSREAEVTRVMIGRLELVSDEQRRLIDELKKPDASFFTSLPRLRRVVGQLGRFGRPLLAHENQFVESHWLVEAQHHAAVYYFGFLQIMPWAYQMPEESRPPSQFYK